MSWCQRVREASIDKRFIWDFLKYEGLLKDQKSTFEHEVTLKYTVKYII